MEVFCFFGAKDEFEFDFYFHPSRPFFPQLLSSISVFVSLPNDFLFYFLLLYLPPKLPKTSSQTPSLSLALCNGFDQLFVTLALKLENAGAVAVIQALCVVLSFLFSIAILQETLYWTSALGGAFIFLSVLMLGFAKMASEMAKNADNGDKKKVPPKSDSNKGGGGRWRRRIFQLNLSTAAAKLKQSKSFDIISSSSSHQQQKVGHLSSLGAFSNPTLSSTDSLSPNFTFAIALPVYPYQNTITSSTSATSDSGLYGVGSEPYLLRVAPINGCEAQHRGLRPGHNNNSIDGNNNVG